MRELLFRAWDHDLKQWCYLPEDGNIELWTDDTKIFAFDYNDEELTIEQYTGLKDKNGVRIFENDIIDLQYNYLGKHLVIFKDGKFSISGYALQHCEIIGNIHENSGLLTT